MSSWWMYLVFQPRRCQVCNSRQARMCNVQQAALQKQTHRNCRRLPHGRYSFSPIRFDLHKDVKSLSPGALCSRQALTSGVCTAHLGRPTVGAIRNNWRKQRAPTVRHHNSSFAANPTMLECTKPVQNSKTSRLWRATAALIDRHQRGLSKQPW